MDLLSLFLLFIVGVPSALFVFSWAASAAIGKRYGANGAIERVDGIDLHYVFWPGEGEAANAPPALFIHGASGNLRDPMSAMASFRGRWPMIFVDRPGHGWSGRGHGHDRPDGQARAIAALIGRVAPEGVVAVGHSFGGAVALDLAMNHPERVRGLVLLSPATHPWPGGETNWYYRLASRPLLGRLFAWTLALPGGLLHIGKGVECVFAPNRVPKGYAERAAIALTLRPRNFRANAIDVEGLFDHVTATSERYPSVTCPTVILTGDSDTVVYEHVHSVGCVRDIVGAELFLIRNCGHKSDHVAPRAVLAAIGRTAARPVEGIDDLQAEVAVVEAVIARDDHGGDCALAKPDGCRRHSGRRGQPLTMRGLGRRCRQSSDFGRLR